MGIYMGPYTPMGLMGPMGYWGGGPLAESLRWRQELCPEVDMLIWNIMGTLSVILFSIIDVELVRSLTIMIRNLPNLVRNTIPKWSKIDPKWANAALGGASRRRGLYLVMKVYIWSVLDCISYQVRQIWYHNRQTSCQLRTNHCE